LKTGRGDEWRVRGNDRGVVVGRGERDQRLQIGFGGKEEAFNGD